MFQTIVTGLVGAAFSGVTFVAYQHPSHFRSYAKDLDKLLNRTLGSIIAFLVGGIIYVAIAEPLIGKELADKVPQAVYSRIGAPSAWVLGAIVTLKAYGWFLLKFVAPLRKSPAPVEPKAQKSDRERS